MTTRKIDVEVLTAPQLAELLGPQWPLWRVLEASRRGELPGSVRIGRDYLCADVERLRALGSGLPPARVYEREFAIDIQDRHALDSKLDKVIAAQEAMHEARKAAEEAAARQRYEERIKRELAQRDADMAARSGGLLRRA